jgi:hypothetical protein
MNTEDNLTFSPKPISAVGLCAGEGTSIRIAIAIVQRTTALRAYNSFAVGRDWLEKLSIAYVVALATRSADTLLMQHIQNCIDLNPPITCAKCKEATIGTRVIRERVFPKLTTFRTHANKLIHHLDSPENQGIAKLNIQGVFDYCHHLFQDNAGVLLGDAPVATFEFTKCKDCRAKRL